MEAIRRQLASTDEYKERQRKEEEEVRAGTEKRGPSLMELHMEAKKARVDGNSGGKPLDKAAMDSMFSFDRETVSLLFFLKCSFLFALIY